MIYVILIPAEVGLGVWIEVTLQGEVNGWMRRTPASELHPNLIQPVSFSPEKVKGPAIRHRVTAETTGNDHSVAPHPEESIIRILSSQSSLAILLDVGGGPASLS